VPCASPLDAKPPEGGERPVLPLKALAKRLELPLQCSGSSEYTWG
jgi:hypothetical protein